MKSLSYISLLIFVAFLLFSCNGGVENTPAAQNSTKAFQIGSSNESYDTLQQAVQSLKEKSKKGAKAASESYTIRLNWDKTDSGATISGIDAEVKLDFQGHTLTLSDGSEGIVIANTGKAVEIANGTVQVAEGATLKAGTTAVITASSDTTLSASVNASNTEADAITTTGGSFNIQGAAKITSREDKRTIVAMETSVIKVNSSQVVLTGGMKLDGNANVDLGDAKLKLTQDIEKGDECRLEVKAENVEPQNDNVQQDKIEEARHNHSFSSVWTYDTTYHWHDATCGHELISSKAEHSWDNGTVTTEATHTADGVRTYTCTVCGATRTESIPALVDAHTYSDVWSFDEIYHWHKSTCGQNDAISDYSKHVFSTLTENFTNSIIHTKTYEICSICGYVDLDSVIVKISAPEYDLDEGIYQEGNSIRLSTPYDELAIYYTTDGSNPTTDSNLYVNPIILDRNLMIKAFSYYCDGEMVVYSDIVSKSYYVKVAKPQFSLKDSSVVNNTSSLLISSSTEGAQIIYTTDGSTPSATNGNTYSTPISFSSSCMVKAIAIKAGMESSDVVSAEYYHINDISPERLFDIKNGAVSINGEYISVLPSVVVVPEWINGTRVTSVADYGFENCKNIQVLVLPDSITKIGAFAFRGCSSIISFDVGQYITEIASSAFSGWTSSQTINDYSSMIKAGVLSGCNAKINAIVKNGTQAITGYGGMTNLYSIYLPDSVRAIDHQTFSLCTNLSDVTMSGNITAIGNLAFNDCTSISDITLPAILSDMAPNAFRHWTNSQRINDLSGYLYDNRLSDSNARIYTLVPSGRSIVDTDDLRYRSEIYGLEISDTVYEIDDYAFQGTNIERITIPSNAIYLGLELFKDWHDGQTVDYVYNNNCVSVYGDRSSFSGNSAVFNVSFRNGITSISKDAFNGMAGLESVTIPSTVKSVGDRVFKNTSISNIVIPDKVVSLGESCFYVC